MIDCIYDGSSVFARAYYAADTDPVATIPIAIKMVCHQLDSFARAGKQADRLLFCWDGEAKRAKPRTPKPPEYGEARRKLSGVIQELFGASQAWPPAAEADDAVATAAYRSEAAGNDVVVVSGDKDLQQLLGGRVSYWCCNTKDFLERNIVLEKWRVKRPSQIAIALAILGDPGDAVPGIKGWGPKKVAKLFESVGAEMGFQAALDVVVAQIPNDLHPIFYESLDLTLLDPSVPGVPDPAVVSLADPYQHEDTLAEAYPAFLKTYSRYTGISLEDRLLDKFDNPTWT